MLVDWSIVWCSMSNILRHWRWLTMSNLSHHICQSSIGDYNKGRTKTMEVAVAQKIDHSRIQNPENRPFTIEMIQDKVKDISDRILSYFRNKNPTENCYEWRYFSNEITSPSAQSVKFCSPIKGILFLRYVFIYLNDL